MVPKISSGNIKSSLTNILKEVFPNLDPVYRSMMRTNRNVSIKNPLYKSFSTSDMQGEYKKHAVDKFIKTKMP